MPDRERIYEHLMLTLDALNQCDDVAVSFETESIEITDDVPIPLQDGYRRFIPDATTIVITISPRESLEDRIARELAKIGPPASD